MSMREKIANALAISDGYSPEDWHQKDEVYLRYADAVLDALMEPTETMQVVGGTKLEEIMFGGDEDATGMIFTDCGVVFRSMIKAAKEGK